MTNTTIILSSMKILTTIILSLTYLFFTLVGITIIDNHYFDAFYIHIGFAFILVGSIFLAMLFSIIITNKKEVKE